MTTLYGITNCDSVRKARSDIDVMTENPSVIKRPLLETKDRILVGFSEDTWQGVFS